MSALIVSAVVVPRGEDYDVAVTSEDYGAIRRRYARQWGAGTELRLRLEPVADAVEKAERAWYFAHVVRPFADHQHLETPEAHSLLKDACGVTSIAALDADAFRAYVQQAHAQARAWAPDAFVLEEEG